MSNVTHDIVGKLWNLCNLLKDDGVTYHQYVTELTYLLFLKMAKETETESQLPSGYRWDDLETQPAPLRLDFYKRLLLELGIRGSRLVKEILPTPAPSSRSRRRCQRWSPESTSSTGSVRGKRDSATSTKGCWKRTPTKRSPVPGSTSRHDL